MNEKQLNYPPVSDILIQCLNRDFPDKIPRKEVTLYELGFLAGQQSIIEKLKFEAKEDEK